MLSFISIARNKVSPTILICQSNLLIKGEVKVSILPRKCEITLGSIGAFIIFLVTHISHYLNLSVCDLFPPAIYLETTLSLLPRRYPIRGRVCTNIDMCISGIIPSRSKHAKVSCFWTPFSREVGNLGYFP